MTLNEQLSAEVQRLKLASGEISEAQLSKNMNQQMQLSSQLFHLHQLQEQQQQHHPHQQQKQQIAQAPPCQMPPPQQTQNNVSAKLESSRC